MRRVKGATPPRARRGEPTSRLLRFACWTGIPILVFAGIYGGVQAVRAPLGQSTLQKAGDGLLEASAFLGLTVADIRVEGRETTDRQTIIDALGAGPGTAILAVSPRRAKERLEALALGPLRRRSSAIFPTRSMSALSNESRWRCGSTTARSS